MGLVAYRPLVEDVPDADHGVRKYRGEIALGYDAKREQSPKWIAEQRIVIDMLKDIDAGKWILDCPVGTGRFIPYYQEREFLVRAVDVSEDMLELARAKVTRQSNWIWFSKGDIRNLGQMDKSSDVSVMVRLTRWLSPEDCVTVLRELQRISRKRIIFTARVRNHPHARPYELIESSLDGWRIARDEAAGDENYRVIALEPTR